MNPVYQHQNNSNNSDTGSRVDEQTRQKIEALLNIFRSTGKGLSSQLTEEEIYAFLDSKTKDPNGFNRKLRSNLLKQLEFSPNNTITVEQFIQDYVQYDTNLQSNANVLLSQIQTEKENYKNIKQSYDDYKSTRLNEEGIADNAKITVTITEINLQKQLDDIKLITINIQYNDTEKNTQFITGEDQNNRKHLNKQFVFTPRSKKDKFIYVLKGINGNNEEFLIGKKHIDLGNIEDNDKYEIYVEIPEIDDIRTVIANIKTEITFYWNDNANYNKQLGASEMKINKLSKGYEQLKQYLTQLNETYMLNDVNNNNNNNEQMYKNNTEYNTNFVDQPQEMGNYTKQRNESINANSDNLMIYKTAPAHPYISKTENIIKHTFGAQNFSWNVFNKTFASLLFMFGMLNSFYRPDFPNALCAMLILICSVFIIRTFKNDHTRIQKLLKNLLYSVLGLIVYDLIWLILLGGSCVKGKDYYTGGKENGIGRLAFVITILNEVVKVCLAFGLWAQLNKTFMK